MRKETMVVRLDKETYDILTNFAKGLNNSRANIMRKIILLLNEKPEIFVECEKIYSEKKIQKLKEKING